MTHTQDNKQPRRRTLRKDDVVQSGRFCNGFYIDAEDPGDKKAVVGWTDVYEEVVDENGVKTQKRVARSTHDAFDESRNDALFLVTSVKERKRGYLGTYRGRVVEARRLHEDSEGFILGNEVIEFIVGGKGPRSIALKDIDVLAVRETREPTVDDIFNAFSQLFGSQE